MTPLPVWSDFFQEIPDRLVPLFAVDEPVWHALNNLKSFIRESIRPNLPDAVEIGVPLEKPLVILPDGWLDEGFEIICDDTVSRMQVWSEGEMIPEAAVLCAGSVFMDSRIEIASGTIVEPGALLKGPAIIGKDTEIRQGAYLREDCLVCSGCVVGHATEAKHSIMLTGAKAGHFAYIGDSILGSQVNLGAGTKLANLKFGPGSVKIRIGKGEICDTMRRKIGAILGDRVQTGCNSVTNPGVFLRPDSMVLPNTTVKPGIYRARAIIRSG